MLGSSKLSAAYVVDDERIMKDSLNASPFIVKDSGKREEFGSGMVRDTSEGKIQYHRVSEGPMLTRWAEHLTKGAVKYPDNADGSANWTKASGDSEYLRFKQSAFRHFMQWFYGEVDEDHAAAVLFNINGAEYVKTNGSSLAEMPFARDYSPEKVSMKLAADEDSHL
jgi:hypothetical protein